ncbi:uncharacterized protein [Drosophila bipectinata]|uniref:uncharacterized protein isoform X2 n=1 Tax=Drosophila bipectinata TaxID=42026 RepID=UPI001C8A3382|nr:transcriptional regulatory protein LGE1 isoform X2 [Drosophila bipectinata]
MSECIAQIPIKAQARCIFQVIPTKIMDRSVTAICLVLLQLLGSGLGFQEKAPVQTSLVTGQARTDKQQQVLDDPLGSGRGIDEHLLKTIEDQQHPRQYGYGPFYPPPPPPPQRPWGPQPPPPPPPPGPPGPPLPYYNPYYNGGYGGYYGGYGYGGYGYPGYGGYSYPYYPFYRNSASGTEVDNQLPGADGLTPLPVPGVFQGRTVLSDGLTPLPVPGVFQGRAVLPQNFLEGRNNANIVPLFHLLQMARS